jgi:excisionase family DNA binding protein
MRRNDRSGDDESLAVLMARARAAWENDPRFHAEPAAEHDTQTKPVEEKTRTLLTVEDVARLLSVKPSWVRAQARAGRIPHVPVGRYTRFRPDAVEAWMHDHEQAGGDPPSDDVDEDA